MSLGFLKGSSILITGGTGSFGKQCIKALLQKTEARRIIIFSRDEYKQVKMAAEFPDTEGRLRFFIGDVRDKERLERAFNDVDYVIHAAALKHVPILEYNPFEAIKTNILGSKNVIDAAIDCRVKKVILVSTDKAANPANLYGATKLCAERLMISSNVYGAEKTKFSVARYGNVFGSRGSLVELIKKQMSKGEVALTHEDMTRFWITLDQGVNLVLSVLEKMQGGEIFVPKIPSMKIKDLIQILAPGCKLKIIGIRPGEKLHEVLITQEEARHTKDAGDYYVILPEIKGWSINSSYAENKNFSDLYFSSDKNHFWLDQEAIIKLLSTISNE